MYSTTLKISTEKEFTDITDKIQGILSDIEIDDGVVILHTLHTTCGLKIMENEILSLFDIDRFLEDVASGDSVYAHDSIHLRQVPLDERINGVSHVRMLFFQTSIVVPFSNKQLTLGEWQRILLVEMDSVMPVRERSIVISILDG